MAKTETKEKKPGLSLKKPIGKKGGKLPSRTAINLVYQPSHTERDMISLALFFVFLVILALFTKFMVLDQLAAVDEAARAYNEKDRQLQALVKANAEYDEVELEYSHYGISYMNTEELDRQFRTSMLEVINEKVSDQYRIRNIAISGNTATLAFLVQELSEVAEIVGALNESPIVSYVTFTTAATEEKKVTAVDEDGNVIHETIRSSLAANITVHFKTPTQVANAENAEGGAA